MKIIADYAISQEVKTIIIGKVEYQLKMIEIMTTMNIIGGENQYF